VVGVPSPRHIAERDVLVRGPLDLARTEDTRGIPVEQEPQQDLRCVGLSSPCPIVPIDAPQIELGDRLHHEPRQMLRR